MDFQLPTLLPAPPINIKLTIEIYMNNITCVDTRHVAVSPILKSPSDSPPTIVNLSFLQPPLLRKAKLDYDCAQSTVVQALSQAAWVLFQQ